MNPLITAMMKKKGPSMGGMGQRVLMVDASEVAGSNLKAGDPIHLEVDGQIQAVHPGTLMVQVQTVSTQESQAQRAVEQKAPMVRTQTE